MISAYYSCFRCKEKGERVGGTLVFKYVTDLTPRTDQGFRRMENPEHHNGRDVLDTKFI